MLGLLRAVWGGLSFGAIGKGWAVAQCLRILRELGVANALLDAGGSTLYALGTPAGSVALTPSHSPTGWERGAENALTPSPSPTGWDRGAENALTPSPSPTGWERGVGAHGGAPCCAFPLSRLAGEGDKGGEGDKAPLPSEAQSGWLIRLPDGSEMRLRDAALAVAGDTEQYFEVNGVRYGHIIDPRTGYPAPSRPPVAVIGDDPTLCDALSTALYIEPALESIVRTRCRSVSVSTAIDGCGK